METTKEGIGTGLATQYCVLKFIEQNNPNEFQLLRFVNVNRAHLYPPSGSSMNSYLDRILAKGYIARNSEGIVTITNEGHREYELLGKNEEEDLRRFEESLSINYNI